MPAGVFWYVTGQSSALTATGVPELGPEHLGWAPHLLTENDGEVAEGPDVGTIFDEAPNNVGLEGEEFLALALDSEGARAVGTWEANADLVLKTPKDVAPGSYSGTLDPHPLGGRVLATRRSLAGGRPSAALPRTPAEPSNEGEPLSPSSTARVRPLLGAVTAAAVAAALLVAAPPPRPPTPGSPIPATPRRTRATAPTRCR